MLVINGLMVCLNIDNFISYNVVDDVYIILEIEDIAEQAKTWPKINGEAEGTGH